MYSVFIYNLWNIVVIWSLRYAQFFVTPWIAAYQASLSFTISLSLPIELVMPSNCLILCHLLLLHSIFPCIRVFSNELSLHIRWQKSWSFNFSTSPSNEYAELISFKFGLISLMFKGFSRVFSRTTVQKHQFFGNQPSLWSNSHIHTWLLKKNIALTIRNFAGKVMSLLFNTPSRFVIAFLP